MYAIRSYYGTHHLHLPPLGFGVSTVHAEKIGNKKSGLITAGTCPDFKKNIFFIVGILGQEADTDLLFQRTFQG